MAWIETVTPEKAEGLLAKIYADAVKRAGKVWHILRVMSLNPRQLRASMGFYSASMLDDSRISRRMRETLAVVVSQANDCHY